MSLQRRRDVAGNDFTSTARGKRKRGASLLNHVVVAVTHHNNNNNNNNDNDNDVTLLAVTHFGDDGARAIVAVAHGVCQG